MDILRPPGTKFNLEAQLPMIMVQACQWAGQHHTDLVETLLEDGDPDVTSVEW